MFKQMSRLGLIALLAVGVVGAFAPPPALAGEVNPPQPPIAGPPKTIDDMFADVARLAPGFGGLYVDEDQDTLYVYLLQDTPQAVAGLEAALTAVFGREAPKQSRIKVLQGQYNFLELKQWYDHMRWAVLGIPGVFLTDIDDGKNRLRVGVENRDVQDVVEAELVRLGIPRQMVKIEETEPIKFVTSLRDPHRPLVGGLQIESRLLGSDSGKRCTLGFNAIRGNALGFVTASHCTAVTGGR